jgi:hypothetical protein
MQNMIDMNMARLAASIIAVLERFDVSVMRGRWLENSSDAESSRLIGCVKQTACVRLGACNPCRVLINPQSD